MYKYVGLMVFLLVLVMAGFSIYQAVTTGGIVYIVFSVILVVAIVLQLRKMIHVTVTYEEKDDKKKEDGQEG